MTTVKLFIKIEGGCLVAVYGDPTPDDVVLDIVLRDIDNINDGDEDPDPTSGASYVHYY